MRSEAPGPRRKTISFPYLPSQDRISLPSIWEDFDPPTLKNITCDAALWYIVASRMYHLADLVSLTITFSESYSSARIVDPPDLDDEYDQMDDDECLFPSLRTVTFRNTSSRTVEVPSWWCNTLVQTLRIEEGQAVKYKTDGITMTWDRDPDDYYWAGQMLPSAWMPPQIMKRIVNPAPSDDKDDGVDEEDELEAGDEEVEYDHQGFASAYLSSLSEYRSLEF